VNTYKKIIIILCVGVMYSGEYVVCDVTLSACIYPHRACLKKMPGHGENRTYDHKQTKKL
jgi:hypothetical protein